MRGASTAMERAQGLVEWPSLLLCAFIYGCFILLTWFNADCPMVLTIALGGLLIAWHSSMQHEFIHAHPTRSGRINRALATPPLSLWLPFEAYRISHLVHHHDDRLTDPLDDPESFYWTAEQWEALGPLGRSIVRAHTTLAGRLLIGPIWTIVRFLSVEIQALRMGNRTRRRIWLRHAAAVAAVLAWTIGICGMDPLAYAAMVYVGTALLLVRSFAEHRANDGVQERSAIVENSWFLGPLFLFNNLHAAHHESPLIPWYRLPAWYRANRTRLIAQNGGLVYDGYGDVARRFLFRSHDVNVHPRGVAAITSAEGPPGLRVSPAAG